VNCAAQGLERCAVDLFREKEVVPLTCRRNPDRVTSQNFSSGGSQELWTYTFSRGLNWQMTPLNSLGDTHGCYLG
jgi:hypothetical protein